MPFFQNPGAKELLSQWGLELSHKPALVTGRVLDAEKLLFGRSQSEVVNPKGDFARAATNKPLLSAVAVKKWAVLYPKREEKAVRNFVETLARAGKWAGVSLHVNSTGYTNID